MVLSWIDWCCIFALFALFFLYFISSGICDGDGAPLMVTNMILDKYEKCSTLSVLLYYRMQFYSQEISIVDPQIPNLYLQISDQSA